MFHFSIITIFLARRTNAAFRATISITINTNPFTSPTFIYTLQLVILCFNCWYRGRWFLLYILHSSFISFIFSFMMKTPNQFDWKRVLILTISRDFLLKLILVIIIKRFPFNSKIYQFHFMDYFEDNLVSLKFNWTTIWSFPPIALGLLSSCD